MNKKEFNQVSLDLIEELETPLAGSLNPQEFRKLQLDTIIEFIDLILEEYEEEKKQPLDKPRDRCYTDLTLPAKK